MVLTSQKISNANGQIIEGPLLIKPDVFHDERGFFMESWNSNDWKSLIEKNKQEFNFFLQDNNYKEKYFLFFRYSPNKRKDKLFRF